MSSSSNIVLRWSGHDLVFRGGEEGGPQTVLDSAGEEGLSPTQLLLLSLAGCMGIDVLMILQKSRVPVESLEVEMDGDRAESPPRRYLRIRLTYRLRGPEDEHESKLQRAVDLSREKYCSVLHTLDPAVDLDIRIERA